jgi:hypothetical protein
VGGYQGRYRHARPRDRSAKASPAPARMSTPRRGCPPWIGGTANARRCRAVQHLGTRRCRAQLGADSAVRGGGPHAGCTAPSGRHQGRHARRAGVRGQGPRLPFAWCGLPVERGGAGDAPPQTRQAGRRAPAQGLVSAPGEGLATQPVQRVCHDGGLYGREQVCGQRPCSSLSMAADLGARRREGSGRTLYAGSSRYSGWPS